MRSTTPADRAAGTAASHGGVPLLAAIDLGSNSFHLLLARKVDGGIQIVDKVKRKVRLAHGMDPQQRIDVASMQRGWDCLALFADLVRELPSEAVKIVGTNTLRVASNREAFVTRGEAILGHPIRVISGDQEARLIYQGVAHTLGQPGQRLVVDIGGGSTELVIGEGFEPLLLNSLQMGCVTFLDRYFADGELSASAFERAIAGANDILAPEISAYRALGWACCVGASGTVQAIQEVLLAQGHDERITSERLQMLKAQVIACGHIDRLDITGLAEERRLVFPSGLAILIAIFDALGIDSMTTSGGALREGLAYEMAGALRQLDIRARTVEGMLTRLQLDHRQAGRVADVAGRLGRCLPGAALPAELEAMQVLDAAARLNEVGVAVEFRQAGLHGGYMLGHTDLPGFTPTQKRLLAVLVANYRGRIDSQALEQVVGYPGPLKVRLLQLLRLAVVLASLRRDNGLMELSLSEPGEGHLVLGLPSSWLKQHPLLVWRLEDEVAAQADAGWRLEIQPLT